MKDLKFRVAELRNALKEECLVRDQDGVVAVDSVKDIMLLSEYLESWDKFLASNDGERHTFP